TPLKALSAAIGLQSSRLVSESCRRWTMSSRYRSGSLHRSASRGASKPRCGRMYSWRLFPHVALPAESDRVARCDERRQFQRLAWVIDSHRWYDVRDRFLELFLKFSSAEYCPFKRQQRHQIVASGVHQPTQVLVDRFLCLLAGKTGDALA